MPASLGHRLGAAGYLEYGPGLALFELGVAIGCYVDRNFIETEANRVGVGLTKVGFVVHGEDHWRGRFLDLLATRRRREPDCPARHSRHARHSRSVRPHKLSQPGGGLLDLLAHEVAHPQHRAANQQGKAREHPRRRGAGEHDENPAAKRGQDHRAAYHAEGLPGQGGKKTTDPAAGFGRHYPLPVKTKDHGALKQQGNRTHQPHRRHGGRLPCKQAHGTGDEQRGKQVAGVAETLHQCVGHGVAHHAHLVGRGQIGRVGVETQRQGSPERRAQYCLHLVYEA